MLVTTTERCQAPPDSSIASFESAKRPLLPAIGLGTRLLSNGQCSRVVDQAISIGYRYIDTAPVYGNETAVGEGVRGSGIDRRAVFVTTKVERDDLKGGPLRQSVENSLKALKFDYVDLLLIHWPNENIALAESLAVMCDLKRTGIVSHIGVANFPIALLDHAIELASRYDAIIAVNQLEIHPSLPQTKLVEACHRRGVATIAYSPLGRDDLDDPIVVDIASRVHRSPAQVILRWHYQRGVLPIPIPSAATLEQIAEQYRIFEFELSAIDLRSLSSLTRSTRYFDPAWAPEWDPQL